MRAITDSALASVRRRVAASTADGPLDELDDAQIHMWDAAQAAHDRAAYGQHEERLIECPVCCPPYAQIAAGLPTVQRSLTRAVCRLSGEMMNEDNPATVLPDGNVYSFRALQARCNSDGRFAHPITGEMLELDQMRKAFFL